MALLVPRFRTSSLQNCKRLHFCCFTPGRLWYFTYGNPRKHSLGMGYHNNPCLHAITQAWGWSWWGNTSLSLRRNTSLLTFKESSRRSRAIVTKIPILYPPAHTHPIYPISSPQTLFIHRLHASLLTSSFTSVNKELKPPNTTPDQIHSPVPVPGERASTFLLASLSSWLQSFSFPWRVGLGQELSGEEKDGLWTPLIKQRSLPPPSSSHTRNLTVVPVAGIFGLMKQLRRSQALQKSPQCSVSDRSSHSLSVIYYTLPWAIMVCSFLNVGVGSEPPGEEKGTKVQYSKRNLLPFPPFQGFEAISNDANSEH